MIQVLENWLSLMSTLEEALKQVQNPQRCGQETPNLIEEKYYEWN
jgi:hypothetical protein